MFSFKEQYFEGWYFRNTKDDKSISFIPGVSISRKKKEAFIQVITNNSSSYFLYDYLDFYYNANPFYIKIGNNYFSLDKIKLDMNNKEHEEQIKGELIFDDRIEIKKNILSPNIMGIFAYVPNMECNHGVLSLYHNISGTVSYNKEVFCLDNGIGYIEKDWGKSFPEKYVWIQANNFNEKNTSLFFSYATIPYKNFKFNGHICIFLLNGQEYRFATYNFSKVKINTQNKTIAVLLKKRKRNIRN